MTDLSVKNRIIALSSFILVSIALTIRNINLFTFVLFGCLGLVIFFADKILDNKKIQERTLSAFFAFAVSYQTFFQAFNRIHDNNKQLLAAFALAIFLAAVFASTDRKKFLYSILSAPLMCFLDTRIASAYCTLLLSFSVVIFLIESRTQNTKKKQNKKKTNKAKNQEDGIRLEPATVNLISIIVSAACLAFCLYYTFKNKSSSIENSTFLLIQFKNTLGFSILIIYLFVKLLRSNLKVNIFISAGLILHIAVMIFSAISFGWIFFSLHLISITMFLGLVCLESKETVNKIKEDCQNHKYLFFIEILCLLQ